jgi:hypothetical protein
VEGGGVLLVDNALGLFDINGMNNPHVPPATLEHWGIREQEAYWLPDEKQPSTLWERLAPMSVPPGADITPLDTIYTSPMMEFTFPIRASVRARTYLTPLILSGPAQGIASCEGMTVAARVNVGMGTIYYFGTNMGTCIHQGDRDALAVVKAVIAAHTAPVVRGERLRPRLIQGDGEALLIVANPSSESVQETLSVPHGYQSAADVHSRSVINLENDTVEVHVPQQDVTVIALRP